MSCKSITMRCAARSLAASLLFAQTAPALAGPCPAAGSCFAQHPTPGCNNQTCCETVCEQDPFCCDDHWDNFCVTGANQSCCGGNLTQSCFTPHNATACNIASCCNAVCAQDPFCCEVEWDQLCVDRANDLCTCGGELAGDCFTPQNHPGCDDAACCEEICSFISFCCNLVWDAFCAQQASEFCCGGNQSGSCFQVHDNHACNIATCCEAVCEQDPVCCESEDFGWDFNCVNAALAKCACGGPLSGSCFQVHDNPGCSNATCCQSVCALDPFCCNVQWDGICVNEALDLCVPGDVDGSGIVNITDLVLVITGWGCNTPPCQGDADGNGVTNVGDLLLVITNWD